MPIVNPFFYIFEGKLKQSSMSKRRLQAIILFLTVLTIHCGAQEYQGLERQRSFEILTGMHSISTMMSTPGHPDHSDTWKDEAAGIGKKPIFPPNLMIAYTDRISEHWDLCLIAGVSGWFYSHRQYPASGEGYDWNADPVWKKTEFSLCDVAVAAIGRYNWVRRDSWQLYSSIGLGVSMGIWPSIPILPHLGLIGVRFGRNKWYGIAELSVGPTAAGPMAGIGYRL